jgi:hypothetical protein
MKLGHQILIQTTVGGPWSRRPLDRSHAPGAAATSTRSGGRREGVVWLGSSAQVGRSQFDQNPPLGAYRNDEGHQPAIKDRRRPAVTGP